MLEVLFSIFVVAVGLLSLASLIPAAKVLLVDAGKSDRGAACGQAALSEIKIRGLLNPGMGAYLLTLPPPTRPLCIDPLYIGRNGGAPPASLESFPYGAPAAQMPMQRITLWPALTAPVRALLADRIFSGEDDVTFELPPDEALRAKRVFSQGADLAWGISGTDDDGIGGTDDIGEAGWPGSDDTAFSTGDYTWLATVTPAISQRPIPFDPDGDGDFDVPQPDRTMFTVSVAVFYKRNFVPPDATTIVPSERVALAHFNGSGLGGGDVQLTPLAGTVVSDDYFKLKPNQWIMLAGFVADSGAATATTPQGTGLNRPLYRWYRIASLASEVNDLGRDVTLAGPDWLPGTMQVDTDGDGFGDELYDADNDTGTGVAGTSVMAFLFDNVVGVYEQTIKLDQPSLWSNQ